MFKLHWENTSNRVRAALLLWAILSALSFVARAQSEPTYTFSTLHTFNGTNGANPDGSLIMDAEGNMYSTTAFGGNDAGCDLGGGYTGCGTVFKLDKAGKQTMLYKFPTNGTHGTYPNVGLIADKAGNLYGVTGLGGTGKSGAVFKLNSGGKETVLYNFTGGTGGGIPNAFLIFDAAEDNLYGTTEAGGDASCSTPFTTNGCGVVFKVNKATGKETVLYAFTGSSDGANPLASLLMDTKGNLYGTAALGGDLSCTYYPNVGCGVVFEISKATGKESVLYAFTGGDGFLPSGALYLDAGDLYGTTLDGGTDNYGVVFKLNPSNKKETVLYSFTGGTDGGDPDAGLITDPAGNFYSTTNLGGDLSCSTPGGTGCGVVFKLNKTTNKETVLYSFTGGADGAVPAVSLLRDKPGNLYGTTYEGGDPSCGGTDITGCGTVFKLAP